jgi:chemotaxis protein MotB
MVQKKKEEESKGAPEWMCTFSDMMSLLLCFFVLLFAVSTVEEQKFMKSLGLIKGSFGRIPGLYGMSYVPPINYTPQRSAPTMEQRITERLKDTFAEKAKEKLIAAKLSLEVQVRAVKEGTRFEIQGELLFRPGSAEISGASATATLDPIMAVLAEVPNRVRIEGHTDSVWNEGAPHFYQDNFDLAAARAYNVLRYMETHRDDALRIAHDRLSFESFGPNHPRAPNDTPEGRQQNRRVSIILLDAFESEILEGQLNVPGKPPSEAPIEEVMPSR